MQRVTPWMLATLAGVAFALAMPGAGWWPLALVFPGLLLEAVERDSRRLSGVWVFRGTRVPVRTLFENLEDGATVDDFLEWFPGVTRAQVETVLNHVSPMAIAGAG